MNPAAARPYSLGWRLSWWFAVQTLLGLGALSTVIYLAGIWSLADKADAELARKAQLLKHLVAEAAANGDLPTMRHKLDEFFVGREDMEVTLFGPDGKVAYTSPSQLLPTAPQRRLAFEMPAGSQEIVSAGIGLDRSGDARLLAGLATMLAASTVLGTIMISLSGFWIVTRSLAPLHGLAEQTRALRIDRLGQRLRLHSPVEELQPWIEQFNELLGRLDYAYRKMDGFNADVAHELRTPLANLLGQTEILLSRERPVHEILETLGSNLEEIRRLSSIVNDMLFLARSDSGVHATAGASAELRPQIQQVLEFHEAALAELGLAARIDGDARAWFEPGLIRRAVSNLVGNAARFAEPGSTLVVTLQETESQACIEVRNRGPELPPEVLPNLFDRFFRAQSSREGSRENHGLGLAIVAAVARMHGGSTSASSSAGETCVSFSLATAPASLDHHFGGGSCLPAVREAQNRWGKRSLDGVDMAEKNIV